MKFFVLLIALLGLASTAFAGGKHGGRHGKGKGKHHGKGKHRGGNKQEGSCACKKADSYDACKPLIEEGKCAFSIDQNGAHCHPPPPPHPAVDVGAAVESATRNGKPPHHGKPIDCYEMEHSPEKCNEFSDICKWYTYDVDGKKGGKCIYIKDDKKDEQSAITIPDAPATFTKGNEEEFNNMETNQDDGPPPPHRRHGPCHHFFFAVFMYSLGLITACLRSRFCPNCCRCCCKKTRVATAASSQVVIPAVLVSGMAINTITVKEDPAIPSLQ